ncbi:PREDICTED: A disintegrin and metalloproteinase with thrombospondin motifs 7-like, partial [Condylura cristata]|uniref:A disintegrin and metalloproteinase with thrombospondin motifs 7-like n=1 Tax=Condylura cristata TaxID=143302 RepID=UPI000642E207
PGPPLVDDFYYDYNFINFHEDLSYGAFDQPGPDVAGTGGGAPPPPSVPASPPGSTPTPAMGPPGAEDQGSWGASPAPQPRQTDRSPPPSSELAPANPPASLADPGAPSGAPSPGLRGLPQPPTSVGGAETPVASGAHYDFRGAEGSEDGPPPPQWGETNEVSEDGEEAWGSGARALLPRPHPTAPLSPGGAAPFTRRPNTVEQGRPPTTSWGPVEHGLQPTVGDGAPSLPAPLPAAPPPGVWGRASSAPGWEPPSLRTPVVGGPPLLAGTAGPPAATARTPGPWGPPASPDPVLPPTPAYPRWAHSSIAPEAWPGDPGLAEGAPSTGLPSAGNASWSVGNWSQASAGAPRGARLGGVEPAAWARGAAWGFPSGTGATQRAVTPCLAAAASPQKPACVPGAGAGGRVGQRVGSRPCNTQPCAQWAVGPWGQCSAACGVGVQRRLVKCVNSQTGLPEEDSGQCGHEVGPDSVRPCRTQACQPPAPAHCEGDRLAFGFCETLRLLGRCQLPTIRAQCCRSCPAPG